MDFENIQLQKHQLHEVYVEIISTRSHRLLLTALFSKPNQPARENRGTHEIVYQENPTSARSRLMEQIKTFENVFTAEKG